QHLANELERVAAGGTLHDAAKQHGLGVLVAEDAARSEELRGGAEVRKQPGPVELASVRIEEMRSAVAARVRQQVRHADGLAVNGAAQLGQRLAERVIELEPPPRGE